MTGARPSVVVVGGGIAGAAAAWALARHGARVTLVEQEAQAGHHATGRSAAVTNETVGHPVVGALARAGRPFLEDPPDGFADHPLLSRRGLLWVARSAGSLDALLPPGQAAAVERLDADEVRRLVPQLRPDWAAAGGLYESDARSIDVAALLQAYLRGLRAAGGEVRTGTAAISLHRRPSGSADTAASSGRAAGDDNGERSPGGGDNDGGGGGGGGGGGERSPGGDVHSGGGGHDDGGRAGGGGPAGRWGGWVVTLAGGEVRADVVVDAAGAWGDVVAERAGVAPLGLVALRRTACIVAVPGGDDVTGWPLVMDADGRFYAEPEPGGLLLSPADETPTEPGDARPDELDVALALDRLREATTLPVRSVRRAWAGLRTFAPDRVPVAGFDPGTPGFYWLVGQGGGGIKTAPALAALVAADIVGAPPPDLAPDIVAALRPARFR